MSNWFINSHGRLQDRRNPLRDYDPRNIADQLELRRIFHTDVSVDQNNRVTLGRNPLESFDLDNIADQARFEDRIRNSKQ